MIKNYQQGFVLNVMKATWSSQSIMERMKKARMVIGIAGGVINVTLPCTRNGVEAL